MASQSETEKVSKNKRRKRARKLRIWENVLASSFYQRSLANSSPKTKTTSTKEIQIKHNYKMKQKSKQKPDGKSDMA